MVIHVENAAIADTAVMRSIGFPYVAHLAVPPSLGLISHIEAPVWRNDTWICHDALVEGCDEVQEEHVVDEHEEDSVKAPQFWHPDEEHKRDVNAKDDTQYGSNKAHAIDALCGEGSSPLHG